ncbi:MAG: hypothetical protein PGN34_16205 [Methylobacterium frigidaeris]
MSVRNLIAAGSAADLLLLCAGLVVWSSAFVALYAALSLGCAFGWDAVALGPVSLQRGILVGLWLAHLALIAALLVWLRRRAAPTEDPGRFLARATLWASVVALAVTAANYAPILGLSACL